MRPWIAMVRTCFLGCGQRELCIVYSFVCVLRITGFRFDGDDHGLFVAEIFLTLQLWLISSTDFAGLVIFQPIFATNVFGRASTSSLGAAEVVVVGCHRLCFGSSFGTELIRLSLDNLHRYHAGFCFIAWCTLFADEEWDVRFW
jgi:hypothetical protein